MTTNTEKSTALPGQVQPVVDLKARVSEINALADRPAVVGKDRISWSVPDALPCPFCGSADIRWSECGQYTIHGPSSTYRRIVCFRCGSGTTPFPPDARSECVILWNSRAPNATGERRGIPRTIDPIVGNLDLEVTQ